MIKKILKKYDAFKRNYWYPDIENPYKTELKASTDLESNLQEKWESHIGDMWYGFSIGRPCPDVWFNIIDEFLEYIKTISPKFEIHQIKMKLGGIRFYVEVNLEDEELKEFVNYQIDELEYQLFDEKLIY